MTLPVPSERYSQPHQAAVQDAIERELGLAIKRGQDINIYPPVKLVLVSPDGSRWAVEVDNTGVLSTTAL